MNRRLRFASCLAVCALAFLACLAPVLVLGETLTDPHDVLAKHYEALGGLDNLKAEKTKYFEATVSVMGLEGTVKEWQAFPIKKRQEVDLKVIKQTSGDNGQTAWIVDQNGKVTIQKDEVTLKKRQVDELLANYEHLRRDSQYFGVSLEGVEKVGDADCYVVKITNTINDDVRLEYIDTATFMPVQTLQKTAQLETQTVFSDIRDVGGLKVPFKQETEIKAIAQKQVVQVTKYESNVPIDPALFEPPGQDAADYTFASGTSVEDIPFKFMGDHLFIDVTINCDKRLWVLDTGAAATVVDSAYAAQLGLESTGDFKGVGAGKTVDARFVEMPAYSVAGIEFAPQKVVSINIAGLFERAGLDVAGILGYDFLSRFVTKIDYANQRISFYRPADFSYSGSGKVVDAPLRENLFALPMTVEGKYSGMWSLDLGASGSSFFYSYGENHGLMERPGLETLAGGAGGYFTMRASKYDSVELAGFALGEQVFAVPLEKGGAFGARAETGNLGNDILRHFVVYLDYKDQRVIFEQGADFGKDFPRGKAGLGLVVADDGTYQVFYVSKGTPAWKAHFQEGDVVEAINGIPVEAFDGLMAISELFKAEAGTVYDIKIARDGKTHDLKLKLEDML